MSCGLQQGTDSVDPLCATARPVGSVAWTLAVVGGHHPRHMTEPTALAYCRKKKPHKCKAGVEET